MKSTLQIYNTAEKKKKEFRPLFPPKVKMYCCGPTVYDYLHIGNFRGAVFFNFVRNWLEFLGWKVDYIYNFTDIDDKILTRANEEGIQPKALAEKYIKEFQKDYQSLKLKSHSANPRATETLSEIIALIEKLITQGKAYEIEGDVFYSVHTFKEYGYLSKRKKEDLLAGTRIDIDKRKKSPLDFALWKKSKANETWHFESPWGKGRPGWHIECTAMIHKFLGEEIDIHAGGSDLIFPHHENEIAQSEACTNKTYVQFWMHNNMIVTEGDKMSKSLGNMISMRNFLEKNPGELFKFLILSCHYRSPLQFSKKTLQQALVSLSKIYSNLAIAQELATNNKKPYLKFQNLLAQSEEEIVQAFNDDFATPKAFSVLFSTLNEFQKIKESTTISAPEKSFCASLFLDFFKKFGDVMSLFQEEPKAFLKSLDDKVLKEKNLSRQQINELVEKRFLARKNKDFKTADKLRNQLDEIGIEIRDTVKGSEWNVKKHM